MAGACQCHDDHCATRGVSLGHLWVFSGRETFPIHSQTCYQSISHIRSRFVGHRSRQDKKEKNVTIFPKSSILVLIREPVSYYESVYAGWLKGFGGKYKSIIDPDSWVKNIIESGNDYEKLYKIICNLKKN